MCKLEGNRFSLSLSLYLYGEKKCVCVKIKLPTQMATLVVSKDFGSIYCVVQEINIGTEVSVRL